MIGDEMPPLDLDKVFKVQCNDHHGGYYFVDASWEDGIWQGDLFADLETQQLLIDVKESLVPFKSAKQRTRSFLDEKNKRFQNQRAR